MNVESVIALNLLEGIVIGTVGGLVFRRYTWMVGVIAALAVSFLSPVMLPSDVGPAAFVVAFVLWAAGMLVSWTLTAPSQTDENGDDEDLTHWDEVDG